MTREEYMKELNRRLDKLNVEGKEEIINDFNNHFEMGHQDGISDEELILSLGPISEILGTYENISKKINDDIIVDDHPQQKEYTNKITALDISARHADTLITESLDGRIHVNLYKEGTLLSKLSNSLTTYQEEEVYFIKVLPLFPYKINGHYELKLEIPNDLTYLTLGTSSGDLYAKDLNIHNVKIRSASGDLTLNGIHSQKIAIEVASSEMKLKELYGDLNISTASGDVRIDQSKGNNFTYKAASGDLKINGDYDNINLTNVSGDVFAEFKTIMKMNVNSTSGDIRVKVDNHDNFVVNTHSLSGDCHLKLEGKEIRFERSGTYQIGQPFCNIKLNTLSGDIRIDME